MSKKEHTNVVFYIIIIILLPFLKQTAYAFDIFSEASLPCLLSIFISYMWVLWAACSIIKIGCFFFSVPLFTFPVLLLDAVCEVDMFTEFSLFSLGMEHGPEGVAWSWDREGSDWILGIESLPRWWSGNAAGSSERWSLHWASQSSRSTLKNLVYFFWGVVLCGARC